MKLKAGGSRLLKCELFQYQKHNPVFASLLYPWGPSRKWRSHEKWNWKEFNERTIYKGVGRCQGATRDSEAPGNPCPRRLHHPRPEEMSGFAASVSGRGSSCGRGGRMRVLWPQWRKVRTIQLHLGEEGLGRLKSPTCSPPLKSSCGVSYWVDPINAGSSDDTIWGTEQGEDRWGVDLEGYPAHIPATHEQNWCSKTAFLSDMYVTN